MDKSRENMEDALRESIHDQENHIARWETVYDEFIAVYLESENQLYIMSKPAGDDIPYDLVLDLSEHLSQ